MPPLQDNPEEQYHLLMENVKDFAIFLLDTEGGIATWNSGAERILGYKDTEILGQNYRIIFPPDAIVNGEPEKELSIALEKGRSEDERWHVRKDSSQFWASGVVTPLWDEVGKLRGYAKVMRDITDRKRAETELANANRRKDEFLAMLAHELRNPLAPILNTVHVLRMVNAANPEQLQSLDRIDRQTKHLVRLVDDLLDVSRINKGKIQLRTERVELRTVVNHSLETVRFLMDSRKHELTITLPPESIWLEADPARLTQVLANLLNNAAKYTEPGGKIWLNAEREGAQLVVRIKDTGIGIMAEMLPRVFDLFVQADRSLDRSQGGLGIGLTLVYALVRMHGGTIEAHSPGVGKGSEFVVRLPVGPEIKPLSPEQTPVADGGPNRSLRVLIVDDNSDTVASLAMVLRLYGHVPTMAKTGPEGLREALTQQHDVILMDLGLPGIDGFEVARRIREQRTKTVLIAMTGFGQKEDRQRSQEAGFDFHFVKPIDPEKLQGLLNQVGMTHS